MAMFDRVIWIVLDSVGIGALPDAADYDDVGRNTLGHIAESRPLRVSNLVRLGLANVAPLTHLQPAAAPLASFGKGATVSPGKDTTTGHWEMAGIWLDQAFPVYPNGFPPRNHRRVRSADRPRNHRQQARFRHRNHQGTRRGARAHRQAHRVHVGRQRLSDRHARRRDSHRRVVPHVRNRAKTSRWARTASVA